MKESEVSNRLYCKYEYLANKYASKIFYYEELSFEFEDLVQEFKIKIFTSIKSYGKRWSKYRKGEASKPVPIRYYLEAACSNKMRDFIKYISRENYKVRIDDINYDYGVDDETQIRPEVNKFVVNGVNLLEGLSGKEKAIFSLFLKGYNKNLLNKVYFNNEEKKVKNKVVSDGDEPFTVTDIIEMQKTFLINKYGNELLQQRRVYSHYEIEE